MVSPLYLSSIPCAVKVVLVLGASLALGACSLSFPFPGFVERDVTGSIKGRASAPLLSSELDREDMRRANAALAVALDPQGNGANVAWANPVSGAGGSFVALAPPFPEHDSICRQFGGNVLAPKQIKRKIKGSACQTADGGWSIADLSDQK